jgi:uncharacterized membrane protein YqjE
MNIKTEIEKYLKLGELKNTFVQLVEAKFELKKLELQEKVEQLVTDLVFLLVASFFGFAILLLLSVLLGEGLNQWLGSPWLGYVLVVSLYLLIFIGWVANRTVVKQQIKRRVEELVDEKMK